MVKWLSALTAPKFFEISRISSADEITEPSITMLAKRCAGSLRGRTYLEQLLRRRFYVVLVVDSERSHQDAVAVGAGRIFFDRIFTHPTSFERFAHLAFHLACRQQIGGVIGQIAEVAEVP